MKGNAYEVAEDRSGDLLGDRVTKFLIDLTNDFLDSVESPELVRTFFSLGLGSLSARIGAPPSSGNAKRH
jgi:hypothetical protein